MAGYHGRGRSEESGKAKRGPLKKEKGGAEAVKSGKAQRGRRQV